MSVETLTHKLIPPDVPVEAVGSWREIEASIGTILPKDFKEFVETYGSGTIAEFLSVLNPFSSRPGLNLGIQSLRQLDALRTLINDFGEVNEFSLYPATGGLLPVAITDNGDVIHWLTAGEPEQWSIVVNEARSPDYERFDSDITTFLERLLDGSITCKAFPRGVFEGNSTFRGI